MNYGASATAYHTITSSSELPYVTVTVPGKLEMKEELPSYYVLLSLDHE